MSGAERLAEAIERSISSGNLSSEMREQIKEMIAALKDPKNQAILGGALAAVGIAQFTPAGPVVDSIVGIIGYILVGKAVLEAAPDLAHFVTAALEAKDDSDFDQAGQYFARGISPLLVQAGTTLVGMGVAKATSAGAKLVGKRIAALRVSKNPITSEGGKLRVDPKVVAEAEAEGATAVGKAADAAVSGKGAAAEEINTPSKRKAPASAKTGTSTVAPKNLEEVPPTPSVSSPKTILPSVPAVVVNNKGVPYPTITDPRNGKPIPFPEKLVKTPKASRVPWTRSTREAFIEEWQRRNFPEPPGGWSEYEIHHIQPREWGRTNDFDNLVPVKNQDHRKVVTPWWNSYSR